MIGLPCCQTETAAPKSLNLSKFSWKSGSKCRRSSTASSCIPGSCRGGCLSRKRKSPLRTAATTTLQQRLDCLQVRVLLGQFSEARVHFEAGLQIVSRFLDIAEQRVVAAHVVVVNRLSQQRDRTLQQQRLCLRGLSQFIQAKSGVQITGPAVWRNLAKFAADSQRAQPTLPVHQMMKPELEDFRSILKTTLDRVQLGDRFARHAEFGITAGRTKLPLKVHIPVLSKKLARLWKFQL